ncbi:hypothetical protein U1Q18_022534 [Sarracenia purpurea var. burkii]
METPNPKRNNTSTVFLDDPVQGEDNHNPSPQRFLSKASDQGTVNEEGEMDKDPVELEGETEISDIRVKSFELDIALAQQKLKNTLDTKAHQDRTKKGKDILSETESSLEFVPRQVLFSRGTGGRGGHSGGRGLWCAS